MRTILELLSSEPSWPTVQQWIAGASNPVEVLAARDPDRSQALESLQVTTRSPMGAVVYETGGLLVDGGWLRVLGSGHPRLPRTLPGWNAGRAWTASGGAPPILLVADDVVGGSYAVNGGGLPGPTGHVHYFAPDTLSWESLDMGYSDFLVWALTGDLDRYYETFRWPGWRTEIRDLPGDHAISIYPYLWAAGLPVAQRMRRPVPMSELLELQFDVARQMAG